MKKKEGFEGQEAIVLPRNVVRQCENLPVIQDLHITDIGYYPRARYHYRERPAGAGEHILIYCVSGHVHSFIGKKTLRHKHNQYLSVTPDRKAGVVGKE